MLESAIALEEDMEKSENKYHCEGDASLVEAMLNGDRACIEYFFQTTMLPVFCWLKASLKEMPLTVPQIMSDAFVLMCRNDWKALRAFRGTCSLKSYVGLSVRRYLLKKAARQRKMIYLDDETDERGDSYRNMPDSSTVELSERGELIKQAFLRLKPEQQNLLRMKAEGWSSKKLAEKFHTSPGNIDIRVKRTRDEMKQFIQKMESIAS